MLLPRLVKREVEAVRANTPRDRLPSLLLLMAPSVAAAVLARLSRNLSLMLSLKLLPHLLPREVVDVLARRLVCIHYNIVGDFC
jgi:hypothetical protein